MVAGFVTAIFLLAMASIGHSDRPLRRHPLKLGAIAIFVTVLGIVAWSLQAKVRFVQGLRALRDADVLAVTVNAKAVTDPAEARSWVEAVSRADYFAPEQGGWDHPVTVEIQRRDGRITRITAAAYVKAKGMVLISPDGRYAFTGNFPAHGFPYQ